MGHWMERLLVRVIRHRLLVCGLFGLVALLGWLAFRNLPIDAFPDLTNNQVQIISESPGMPPLEVEQLVTIPVESMMNGLPRVEQVRSISKFGLSVVTVVFQDSVNVYFARQLVNERLQTARERLPEDVRSELGPITTAMGEIYQYVLEGQGVSAMDLKTLHDWDIKLRLRTVPGVNEVNTWGGHTQEYVVRVYPDKLVQHQLTLQDVFDALRQNNRNFSGGLVEKGPEQLIVRGLGRVNAIEDIEQILIKHQGGTPIPLYQVGRVELGQALRQGAVTKDGSGEVVTGMVMMLKGENSRDVIQRVKTRIQEIQASLPPGMIIRPFYDQTRLVEETLNTVRTNLLEGGMLVVAVLLLMLGNVRAALIVAAVIPFSLLCSFLGMKALGITANIMSLGAIDFGMIVDGSIVMVENTLRRLNESRQSMPDRLSVVLASVREMARPILFGMLIITVVYIPVLSLQGLEYKLFSPMVFTVCLALFGALVASLVLVPVLCSFFLKPAAQESDNFVLKATRPVYQRLLASAMAAPRRTMGIALALFLLTLASVPFLGTEFVPELDEGDLIVEVRNFPSISLSESTAVSTRVERALRTFPEVKTVVSKTGRPDLATDPMGVYQTDTYVILKPRHQWRRGIDKEELVEEMSQRLNRQVAGAHFNFTQPIAMRVDELVSGVRSDLAIKIFGPDFVELSRLADEIQKVLQTVPGQTDLQVEKLSGAAQWVIYPDRVRMARYGVTMQDIQEVVETAVLGHAVSEVLEGNKRFALRVKLAEESTGPVTSLDDLLIETTGGPRIPLAQIAQVRQEEGLELIQREQGQRRMMVQCNVRGRDIGSFVRDSQALIAKAVTLPPGYTLHWSGQFENQQRAMAKLAVVVPGAIAVIFLLLWATFNSVRYALLVLLNVPFALIGGILALWLRGMYLSVPAMVGLIALFGVAVLNGLVLVSTINQLREEQQLPLEEAIAQAAATRLRPVLMTAMVAALGFFPMALSAGAGAEVQKPLATVVIGGLFSSTLLTLLVIPVVYAWVHRRESLRHTDVILR